MAIYESLQFYKTFQVTTLLDIAFGILPLAIFVWFFRRIRWIFLSVVAVESWFNLTNCSEVNSAKHLSKYLFLSMMTTSLPLSCFIVTIFWLFDKFLIFSLCLYGTKNFSKNPKYDRYQGSLASIVYDRFDKRSTSIPDKSASDSAVKNENMSNQHLWI